MNNQKIQIKIQNITLKTVYYVCEKKMSRVILAILIWNGSDRTATVQHFLVTVATTFSFLRQLN